MNIFSPEYIKDKTEYNKICLSLKDIIHSEDSPFFCNFDVCIDDICYYLQKSARDGLYEKSFIVCCNDNVKHFVLKLMFIIKDIFIYAGYRVFIKSETPELIISWSL